MTTTCTLTSLLFCLLFCCHSVTAQSDLNTAARLFVRYERATSGHRISEDALRLKNSIGHSGATIVAIRVCAEESFPLSAANAINPFNFAELLWSYGYLPEQVMFLRSDKCSLPPKDPHTPATEVWIVPEGASLPPHVEALKSNCIRLSSLGRKPSNRGVRDYKAALKTLIKNLKSNSTNAGVVFGFFLEHPSPALQRRMREVTTILEQSGLSRDRFLVRLRYWNDEVSIYPRDSEPQYPSVFLVEVIRKGEQR